MRSLVEINTDLSLAAELIESVPGYAKTCQDCSFSGSNLLRPELRWCSPVTAIKQLELALNSVTAACVEDVNDIPNLALRNICLAHELHPDCPAAAIIGTSNLLAYKKENV